MNNFYSICKPTMSPRALKEVVLRFNLLCGRKMYEDIWEAHISKTNCTICFWNRMLFLGSTTYDVHRSIKNNQTPPSKEQIQAFEDYLNSVRRPS
ncbi:hypothetical protein H5410_005936 [Solanum commersonii]|uniref:Uncharacterized protein n=1 Tax=Solanum commersonii TaxID=4109 RepID=A0A9J6A7S8_SOLCO|nr:hypothetical protein H5410_005936 [Solanum commersonii]